MGIVEDQQLGARRDIAAHVGDAAHKGLVLVQVDADDAAAGNDGGIDVDRKSRGRHQYRVTRAHQGQAEMRDTFLGADGADDFGIAVQIHTVVLLIAVGDFAAQAAQAVGRRIAVGLGVARHFAQFFTDGRGGRIDGVAHAEVDDIVSPAAFFHFRFVDHAEQVGRELVHALGKTDGRLVAVHVGSPLVDFSNKKTPVVMIDPGFVKTPWAEWPAHGDGYSK